MPVMLEVIQVVQTIQRIRKQQNQLDRMQEGLEIKYFWENIVEPRLSP